MIDYSKNAEIEIPRQIKAEPHREISDLDYALLCLYRDEIFTAENQHICESCRAECKRKLYDHSIGHWFMGRDFGVSTINGKKIRLLFVGKNAIGEDFNDIRASFRCPCYEPGQYLWNEKGSAYWTYTKSIVKCIFGDDSMEYVGFTNLLKCNDGNTLDDATQKMKHYCINELAAIRKELELIQPTHIIFYTGWGYDEYIEGLFAEPPAGREEYVTRKIGRKTMPWWETRARLAGSNQEIKILRSGHPERFLKWSDGTQVGFVDAVSEWLMRSVRE